MEVRLTRSQLAARQPDDNDDVEFVREVTLEEKNAELLKTAVDLTEEPAKKVARVLAWSFDTPCTDERRSDKKLSAADLFKRSELEFDVKQAQEKMTWISSDMHLCGWGVAPEWRVAIAKRNFETADARLKEHNDSNRE